MLKDFNDNDGFISIKEDGTFEFITSLDEIILVEITAMGYKNAIITLPSNKAMVLYLDEDLLNLNEVVVTYVDRERELLKKVLQNIPNNYPITPEQIRGKVIEQLALNENLERIIYESEATIVADKMSYNKRTAFGNVSLIDGKLDLKMPLDSSFIRIYAGMHNVHRFDVVAKREAPFDNIDSKKYDFGIKDTLKLDGKVVFAMAFNSPNRTGKLWIEDETFALVKAYYEDTPKGLKPFLPRDSKRLYKKVKVEYAETQGVYRLSYVNYKSAFENKPDKRQVHLNNLFYLENHSAEKKVIALKERSDFSDFLLYELEPEVLIYNPDSIIANNKMANQVKVERILRRLSNQLFAGVIGYDSQVGATFGSPDTNALPETVAMVSWDIGYHWNAKNGLVFNFSSATDDSFSLVGLNYEHTIPLSKSGKWGLILSSGVQYFKQENNVTGFFDTTYPVPIVVTFSPNKVIENANGFGLQGGLQLHRRISGIFSLVAKASLPYSFTQKREFVFEGDNNANIKIEGVNARANNFYTLS